MLSGGGGNDSLEGGPGGDVFILDGNSGNDVIRGFEPGLDILILVSTGYGSAGVALAAMRSVPGGMMLDFPWAGSLFLEGLGTGALRVQDILIG